MSEISFFITLVIRLRVLGSTAFGYLEPPPRKTGTTQRQHHSVLGNTHGKKLDGYLDTRARIPTRAPSRFSAECLPRSRGVYSMHPETDSFRGFKTGLNPRTGTKIEIRTFTRHNRLKTLEPSWHVLQLLGDSVKHDTGFDYGSFDQ